jgi:hypothetical protein
MDGYWDYRKNQLGRNHRPLVFVSYMLHRVHSRCALTSPSSVSPTINNNWDYDISGINLNGVVLFWNFQIMH